MGADDLLANPQAIAIFITESDRERLFRAAAVGMTLEMKSADRPSASVRGFFWKTPVVELYSGAGNGIVWTISARKRGIA